MRSSAVVRPKRVVLTERPLFDQDVHSQSNSRFESVASDRVPHDLVFVDDRGPGIRRRRAGKAFAYYDLQNRVIRSKEVLARIRAMAIPPAYTDVWICPSANGHVQATGRDGRLQTISLSRALA